MQQHYADQKDYAKGERHENWHFISFIWHFRNAKPERQKSDY